uniref:Uncharacterized protein n=1 Tax=Arundo donax TaxID=35708 RepID=A0A0A9NRL1_ARUDO
MITKIKQSGTLYKEREDNTSTIAASFPRWKRIG